MRSVAATTAVALMVLGGPNAAQADETVVVPGNSFPAGGTYLSYFGCTDLYHADTRGPASRIVRDDEAPAGRRAMTVAMPGAGTASGPVSRVRSVRTATSRLTVDAAAGSSGVAYVWFVSKELDPGEVWAGRAELTTSGGGWEQVDAAAAEYTWTRLEAETGTVIDEPGTETIADFTAEHGNGPGYLLAGFGCDGSEFGLDGVEVGTPGSVTTYDLEGWQVSTSISTSHDQVAGGDEVRVVGTSTDPWDRVMGAPMQLEARPFGSGGFEPVGEPVAARADGTVVTTVTPQLTTDYRWVFPETAYADGHRSAVGRVTVEELEEPDVVEPPEDSPSAEPPPPGDEGAEGEDGEAPDEETEQPVPDLPSGDQVTEEQETEEQETEEQETTEPTDGEQPAEEQVTDTTPTEETSTEP